MPKQIKKVRDWQTHKNDVELRVNLFARYCRWFVMNFSKKSDLSPDIATKQVRNPGQKKEVKPWTSTG